MTMVKLVCEASNDDVMDGHYSLHSLEREREKVRQKKDERLIVPNTPPSFLLSHPQGLQSCILLFAF